MKNRKDSHFPGNQKESDSVKKSIKKGMAGIVLAGLSVSVAWAEVPADLQQALDAKDYKKAYKLAEPYRAELDGDPEFDYAYGVAALYGGNVESAVFALERVVVNDPNNTDARLELVEAYVALENKDAARHELTQLRRLSSYDLGSERVQQFTDQLGMEELKPVAESYYRIDFSVGYDSNINLGVGDDSLLPPSGGSIQSGIESGFAQVGARFDHVRPLSSGYVGYFRADVNQRIYWDVEGSGRTDLALTAGASKSEGNTTYDYSGTIRPLWLDGEHYRTLYQLNAGVSTSTDDLTDYQLAAQWTYFDEDFDLLDRNQLLLSAGLSRKALSFSHQALAYVGSEWSDDSAGDFNASDIYGISYRLTHIQAASNSKAYVQIFYQRENHKAENPIYLEQQKDDLVGVTLRYDKKIASDTVLFGRYFHHKNSSNIEHEEYDRDFIQAGIQYLF